MTRRGIFTTLAGMVGAAATAQDSTPIDWCFTPAPPCAGRNNKCPVCGAIADPYHIQRREIGLRMKPCVPPPPKDSPVACGDTIYDESAPKERLVRCARCNAAFFQDEERSAGKEKP